MSLYILIYFLYILISFFPKQSLRWGVLTDSRPGGCAAGPPGPSVTKKMAVVRVWRTFALKRWLWLENGGCPCPVLEPQPLFFEKMHRSAATATFFPILTLLAPRSAQDRPKSVLRPFCLGSHARVITFSKKIFVHFWDWCELKIAGVNFVFVIFAGGGAIKTCLRAFSWK